MAASCPECQQPVDRLEPTRGFLEDRRQRTWHLSCAVKRLSAYRVEHSEDETCPLCARAVPSSSELVDSNGRSWHWKVGKSKTTNCVAAMLEEAPVAP